jgi:hypothetical protein
MDRWTPLALDAVRTYPIKDRDSKVRIEDFGTAWAPGGSMSQWLDSLPRILGADHLRVVAGLVVRAAASQKTIILAMGAHVIKVGLNPVILDLMQRRIISGVAMNGAGIIHDAEVAMVGRTSEDVAAGIGQGKFGMAEETGKLLNAAISEGARQDMGLGRSVGAMLAREKLHYAGHSLLARAYELDIPVTVHVGMGTDIIHCHPDADGAAIGRTSHLDFRIFSRLVSTLEGGVYINLGSAVLLPEVFLKALSLVRNLGFQVKNLTTLNMDFVHQYRPMTNVVHRPTLDGGQGFNLVGHHEIMFPLLVAAILEGLKDRRE